MTSTGSAAAVKSMRRVILLADIKSAKIMIDVRRNVATVVLAPSEMDMRTDLKVCPYSGGIEKVAVYTGIFDFYVQFLRFWGLDKHGKIVPWRGSTLPIELSIWKRR